MAYALPMTTSTSSSRRILVVMSSAQQLALQGHKTHNTGYFLNEFGVPAKRLTDAGYELVIATPRGNVPAMDQSSDHAMFFKNKEEHEEIKAFVGDLLRHASIQTTEAVAAEGTQGYAALFLPGGHAPMTDLMVDPGLGDILRQFLIEAVLVCLIGGGLGVMLAVGASLVFNHFAAGAGFQMLVSMTAIGGAFAVSSLIGVIFGFLPARNAARLDPVEALARP